MRIDVTSFEMFTRFLFIVILAVSFAGLSVPAQIKYSELDSEVTALLYKKDLLTAIREAETASTKDVRSLWWRLNLYRRAAHPEKVARTVSEIIAFSQQQDKPPPYELSYVFKDKFFKDAATLQEYIQLTSTHETELYAKLIEFCVADRAVCDIRGFENFLRSRAEDAWRKADKGSGNWNDHTEIRQLVAWQEKFGLDSGETRAKLTDDLKRNSSNVDAALRFVDFARDGQDLEWVAEVFTSEIAYDYFELGEALATGRARRAASPEKPRQIDRVAVRFLKKSLDLPYSELDRELIRGRYFRFVSVQPRIRNYEKQLRFITKSVLAEAYKSLGEPQLAQPLIEELMSLDKTDISAYQPSFLAGAVQAGSGARVIESKILNEQAARQDSYEYWIGRAQYYRGRKEAERVFDAYRQGLTMVPFDISKEESAGSRLHFIRRFVDFATDGLRYDEWRDRTDELKEVFEKDAESFLKTEFQRSKANLRYSVELLEIIHQNEFKNLFRQIVTSRPELIVDAAASDIGFERILYPFLANEEISDEKKDLIVTELVRIAEKKDITNALLICETLSGLYERPRYTARTVPILIRNLKSAETRLISAKGDRAFDLENLVNRYKEILFEAYLRSNQWQAAEIFLNEKRPKYLSTPYDRLALTAANNGAYTDAVRYWKIKANFDRRNLSEIEALARYAPVAAALREFYITMKRHEPSSPIPDIALAKLK